MNNKTIILVTIVLVIMVTLCIGCCNSSLPIYERLDENGVEGDEGIVIVINDVRYKMFPETKWSLHPSGKVIGYAGSMKTTVELAKGDSERNFMFLHDFGSSMYYIPLYRTDKIIPEPSKSSVNKLIYSEKDFRVDDTKNFSNTITDSKTIQELFDILESGTKIEDVSFIKDFSLSISCFSDEVPGASYGLNIEKSEGKLICGNSKEGYVVMPLDLLEEITGKKIDFSEYTEG